MLKAIAEQAGMKVGVIGTIRNMIGDEVIHTERTTPESVDLQDVYKRQGYDQRVLFGGLAGRTLDKGYPNGGADETVRSYFI